MFQTNHKEDRRIGASKESRTIRGGSLSRLLPEVAALLAVVILCGGLFHPFSAEAAEGPVEIVEEDGSGRIVDEPGIDRQNKTVTVTVKNGRFDEQPDPYEIDRPGPANYHDLGTMGAGSEGTYHFSLSWLPEGVDHRNYSKYLSALSDPKAKKPENYPGFLTVFVLMDEKGSVVYSTNACCLTIDADIALDPGNYTLRALYAANSEEYEDIAREYLCADRSAERWARESGVDSVTKDGTYRMTYDCSLQYNDFAKYQAGLYVGVGIGLLGAGIILLLLWYFSSKNHRFEKYKYDERQLLARGKAATAGFFTMLFLILFVVVTDGVGLFRSLLHENLGFFCMIALLGGGLVFAYFCVMEDAYVALNERSGAVMAFIAIIGLVNGAIFSVDLFTGKWFLGGRFSTRSINGLCAIAGLALILFMILKKLRSSGKDEEEDEDDL